MNFLKKLFGPPTKDQYAKRVIEALQHSGVTEPITYDPETFTLRHGPAGEWRRFFLQNTYLEYSRAPRRMRAAMLKKFYANFPRGAHGVEMSFASAKSMLLPRVRERFYHDAIRLRVAIESGKPWEVPLRVFGECFTVEVVVDLPDHIQSLSDLQLTGWDTTFEEVLAIAKENLWKLSNKNFRQIGPGVYCSDWQDTHDCSRLFLHDLIWQLKVKGDHVAIAPNRSALLVTGSDDPDGLMQIAGMAEKIIKEESRPMTGLAVRLTGSLWQPFLPSVESPAYATLRRLATISTARDYDEQKELLEKLFQKQKQDIFVASFGVRELGNAKLLSCCAWVNDVTDGLLPRADWIALVGPKKEQVRFTTWEEAWQVCPEMFEPTEYYPVRYRVRLFPSEEEIYAMNARDKLPIE